MPSFSIELQHGERSWLGTFEPDSEPVTAGCPFPASLSVAGFAPWTVPWPDPWKHGRGGCQEASLEAGSLDPSWMEPGDSHGHSGDRAETVEPPYFGHRT